MKLYKYVRYSEHLLAGLVKETMWLSSPDRFNDIFDCQYRRAYLLREELNELKVLNEHRSKLNDRIMLQCLKDDSLESVPQGVIDEDYSIISNFIAKFGILSLAESPDSLLMWAHYAGNHTGVCIEYEIDESKFFSLRPVTYSTEYPTLSIYEFGADLVKTVFKVLTTKSMEWAYEKEWRYFENSKGNSEVKCPFAITSVIFGARSQQSQIETIKAILSNRGVLFQQATQSNSRFSVELKPIL